MRPNFPLLLLLLTLIGASGCTTISASQCFGADWYAQSQRAAARGLPVSEVLKQQNACVQHGVVPDRRAFAQGWRAGGTIQASFIPNERSNGMIPGSAATPADPRFDPRAHSVQDA